MEQEIQLLPLPSSFYSLDVNCLLNIFKRLELDDLMSLAESCILFRRVVNRIFQRHYSMSLTLSVVEKGEKYINRVLLHIGPYVSQLEIIYENYPRSTNFRCLVEHADRKNHQILRIVGLGKLCLSNYNFDNVELLTFLYCDFPLKKCFLEKFKKLKHFNILGGKIGHDDLRMVCGKNPGIESFVYRNVGSSEEFDCQLLELMPKVKTFAVHCSGGSRIPNSISNLSSLLVLNQLTKLRLDCKMNLNDFLNNLALKGVLEELELHWVIFDYKTMQILNKFDKLQLLRIHRSMDERVQRVLKSPEVLLLPPKLKRLYLYEFSFTHEMYFATIRSLKYLQSLDIMISSKEIPYFKDVPKLFRETLKVLEDNGGNHRLDVVLPWCFEYEFGQDSSGRYINRIESDRLRIFEGEETNYNGLGIRILLCGLHTNALDCSCMDWEAMDCTTAGKSKHL